MNVSKEREVIHMSKAEFLNKYRNDYVFRAEARAKGIKVIQDNVIFFNPDGTVKAVAGAYIF
jgi:hypothetical protein